MKRQVKGFKAYSKSSSKVKGIDVSKAEIPRPEMRSVAHCPQSANEKLACEPERGREDSVASKLEGWRGPEKEGML